jgi:hypothetical protein
MRNRSATTAPRADLAIWFVGLLGLGLSGAALAQSASDAPTAPVSPPRPTMGLRVPLTQATPAAPAGTEAAPAASHRNPGLNEKARIYYANVWGVDKLRAGYTSSGNLIRFSYRVLQPKLAAPLGNHENTAEMVGIRSNAVLHIPTMEQIGQLRQMNTPEAGKEYWMVFSNKGNLVKPGDNVSVIIGKFRADGIIVE